MGFGDWLARANPFEEENRANFGAGVQAIFGGDVSRENVASAVEASTRDLVPALGLGENNLQNFAVGAQRLALNVTGSQLPGVPGTSALPQRVQTLGHVTSTRARQAAEGARDATSAAVGVAAEGLSGIIGGAVEGVAGGLKRGLGIDPFILILGAAALVFLVVSGRLG